MAEHATLYTGFWHNWDHGRISGATITLSSQDAAVLSAFVAILLSLTGTQVWTILMYGYHQLRYRRVLVQGLEHQERVIVRNSASPGPTAWKLILQLIAWRRPARTLPLAMFALFYMIAVAALSVLVPGKLYADPVRLLVPSNCGLYDVDKYSDSDSRKKLLKNSQEGSLHSQNCYEIPSTQTCRTYPVLNYHFEENTSCPFSPGTCYTQNGSVPITMTTDFLDSRKDLGIGIRDRVLYRTAATCSLISQEDHTEVVRHGANGGSADLIYYYFGWFYYLDNDVPPDNSTYQYSTLAHFGSMPYGLITSHALAGVVGQWDPIPELVRTDADVTLMFFANNGVSYELAVDDPMFSAHIRWRDSHGPSNTTFDNMYTSDSWVSVIGCVRQYELCNAQTGSCSGLQSRGQAFSNDTYAQIGLNKAQIEVSARLVSASVYSDFPAIVSAREGEALRATATLVGNTQHSLPDNQYMIELKSWFTTGIAMFQRNIRGFAVGDGSNREYDGKGDWPTCTDQRTPETGSTVSYCFVRLIVVICVCTILIITAYTLDPLVCWLRKRMGYKPRTVPALWKLDDILQIQRSLFERMGYGKWDDSSWVPTTTNLTSKETFGEIDFRNRRDPRFVEHTPSRTVSVDYTRDDSKHAVSTVYETLLSPVSLRSYDHQIHK